MDDLFESSSSTKKRFQTAIWSVKLAFLFIGIISTGLLLKLAIPYSLNLLLSSLPRLWISFRSWLSPPYLYILVNFIIIGIAASSSFQQQKPSELKSSSDERSDEVGNNARHRKRIDETEESSFSQKESLGLWTGNNDIASDVGDKHVVLAGKSPESLTESWSENSCLTDSDTTPEVTRKVNSSRSVARNASETYLGAGKSTATSLEKVVVESVGVARAKKHENDSMEATWKAINGGGKPLTRQLKKSDTWDVPPQVNEPEPEPEPEPKSVLSQRELRKSETFNDTASTSSSGSASSRGSGGGGGLRRELVLSQDELNRRVEAFIKKFNDEMRLQRQESYKRSMKTVNRAVY